MLVVVAEAPSRRRRLVAAYDLVHELALDGACLGGCGRGGRWLSGRKRVIWNEGEAGDADPFPTSGGSLLARGAYDVTVRFGKDAAEAEAVAEKLEQYEDSDPFEGREYRFVVRRRSNAVVSARVPDDEQPDESDLRDVLDAAERCLRAA